MNKIVWLIGAAAIALGTAAAGANAPADGSDVEAALAQHNMRAAAIALNRLTEARLPAKDAHQPDPLLDRLYSEFFATSGNPRSAAAMLQRVVADPATPHVDRYRLLLATYQENRAQAADAERLYRQIVDDSKASPATALSARYGLARLKMVDDPIAALAMLTAIDRDTVPVDMAWELDLLIERAALMSGTGQSKVAAAALDRAWQEAPSAPVAAAAVAHVASDRATMAGRAGDRQTLIAMLAVDHSNRQPNAQQHDIVADLPLCGSHGITADDVVVIDVANQPPADRPRATLAWANRPGIAAAFMAATAHSGAPNVEGGQDATFALRCRTVASDSYTVGNSIEQDVTGWLSGLGAYSEPMVDEGGGLSSLASKLAARQGRYGPNSPMLLPILFETMMPNMINGNDPTEAKQEAEDAERILGILQQNGAPASLSAMWRLVTIGMEVAAQSKTQNEGQAEAQALMLKLASDPSLSLDTLYTLVQQTTSRAGAPIEFKETALKATLDIFRRRAPSGDPRTTAIGLQLQQLLAVSGDMAGAAAAVAGLGVPANACVLSTPGPNYVSSNITSDDYPGDFVFIGMPGASIVEFDLDTSGNAQHGRLLLEDPPYAFNQIALARAPTIRYDPAHFDGKTAGCLGTEQTIRWQPEATGDY